MAARSSCPVHLPGPNSGVLSVQVINLRRRLGSAEVLAGVNLAVPASSLTCLVGPSGSGKTTLLKILAGQVEGESGRVELGGRDALALSQRDRATAMVFQNFALFPHLSVGENVSGGLESLGLSPTEIAKRTQAGLEAVGAMAWSARRPQELSGGQQQRVALARALATQPKLLLLDEPLSNLDAAARVELRDRLRALTRTLGLTVICVLHDQKDALAMADQLCVMRHGRIIQAGSPIDVYRRPVDSWTATFLGSANLFPGEIVAAAAGEFVATTALGEVRGALSCPAPWPQPGAPIMVCIRPECLHLDALPPDENAFAGQVTDTLFQGDLAVHRFRTPAGLDLQVAELNPRQRVGSKATVFAWAEPEDVVGLPI